MKTVSWRWMERLPPGPLPASHLCSLRTELKTTHPKRLEMQLSGWSQRERKVSLSTLSPGLGPEFSQHIGPMAPAHSTHSPSLGLLTFSPHTLWAWQRQCPPHYPQLRRTLWGQDTELAQSSPQPALHQDLREATKCLPASLEPTGLIATLPWLSSILALRDHRKGPCLALYLSSLSALSLTAQGTPPSPAPNSLLWNS